MAFMRRHINVFLIVAIGIAFLIMGLISYYYQGTFKEVITNYQATKTSLKKCTDEMKRTKEQYFLATSTLNTSKQDIAKYGELYEETTSELDKTKNKLKSTDATLSQTQRSLEETKKVYEEEKNLAESLRDELKGARNDIDDLQKRISGLRSENTKLSAELATCRGS